MAKTSSRLFQPADHVEQALDLARAQGSGRLVENDEIGLERQRLGDFDELALRDREILHLGIERHRAFLSEVGEYLVGAAAHRGKGESSAATELRQENVFHH